MTEMTERRQEFHRRAHDVLQSLEYEATGMGGLDLPTHEMMSLAGVLEQMAERIRQMAFDKEVADIQDVIEEHGTGSLSLKTLMHGLEIYYRQK